MSGAVCQQTRQGSVRTVFRALCDAPLLAALREAGLDTVEGAFGYGAGEDMTPDGLGHRGRFRLHLECDDGTRRELYMKRYAREPLSWRWERWRVYGPGRGAAQIEFDNLLAAHAAHLPTMDHAACGEEIGREGVRRGFVIVSAVPGEALEQAAEPFLERCASDPARAADFTARLASLVRSLHGAGYVHRDLYSSHVFLHEREGGIELRLIDLARMFAPRFRTFRWRVKDLAALQYSMPPHWVQGSWDAFLGGYLPHASPAHRARWRGAIDAKTAYMRWRIGRRATGGGASA